MSHHPVTRTVAALLVPCVLLYAVGCGTSNPAAVNPRDLNEHSGIIISTTDGQFYRLLEWTRDSVGTITGKGFLCTTLEEANSEVAGTPFRGAILANRISAYYEYAEPGVGTIPAILIVLGVVSLILAIGLAISLGESISSWGDG